MGFHTFTVMNSDAMNIRMLISLLDSDFSSFGYISRKGLLGHISSIFNIFSNPVL